MFVLIGKIGFTMHLVAGFQKLETAETLGLGQTTCGWTKCDLDGHIMKRAELCCPIIYIQKHCGHN